MNDQSPRRTPIALIIGVCSLSIVIGAAIAWWTTSPLSTPEALVTPTTPSVPIPVPTVAPSIIPETNQIVAIYLAKDQGNKFQIVPEKVSISITKQEPEAILNSAFKALIAGKFAQQLTNNIPQGTKVNSLTVKGNNIYIDLSPEFTQGGGATSMTNRLGQVIYTATSLEPDGKVWISINGKPLKILGGEGLEVAQPSTRQTFQSDFQ